MIDSLLRLFNQFTAFRYSVELFILINQIAAQTRLMVSTYSAQNKIVS